jgi:hypothetical protein
MRDLTYSIDLPVRGEWANVELLRTSIQSCFATVFSDLEGCYSLAMVTGELIENAIKYGDWARSGEERFRLRVWGEGRQAHILVENPVSRSDAKAEEVLKTLGWMRGFALPVDAYRAKLLEIAAPDRDRGNSKLGLVRIAYEGNCILTAELVRGVLRVQAELTV